MDGSTEDEIGEHIEEGDGLLLDDSDGEDNACVDNGPVDNVGKQIGVRGDGGVRGVRRGRRKGRGGYRWGRNYNNINIKQ